MLNKLVFVVLACYSFFDRTKVTTLLAKFDQKSTACGNHNYLNEKMEPEFKQGIDDDNAFMCIDGKLEFYACKSHDGTRCLGRSNIDWSLKNSSEEIRALSFDNENPNCTSIKSTVENDAKLDCTTVLNNEYTLLSGDLYRKKIEASKQKINKTCPYHDGKYFYDDFFDAYVCMNDTAEKIGCASPKNDSVCVTVEKVETRISTSWDNSMRFQREALKSHKHVTVCNIFFDHNPDVAVGKNKLGFEFNCTKNASASVDKRIQSKNNDTKERISQFKESCEKNHGKHEIINDVVYLCKGENAEPVGCAMPKFLSSTKCTTLAGAKNTSTSKMNDEDVCFAINKKYFSDPEFYSAYKSDCGPLAIQAFEEYTTNLKNAYETPLNEARIQCAEFNSSTINNVGRTMFSCIDGTFNEIGCEKESDPNMCFAKAVVDNITFSHDTDSYLHKCERLNNQLNGLTTAPKEQSCQQFPADAQIELQEIENGIKSKHDDIKSKCLDTGNDGISQKIGQSFFFCVAGELQEAGCIAPQSPTRCLKLVGLEAALGVHSGAPAYIKCHTLKRQLFEKFESDSGTFEDCNKLVGEAFQNATENKYKSIKREIIDAQTRCGAVTNTDESFYTNNTLHICAYNELHEIGCKFEGTPEKCILMANAEENLQAYANKSDKFNYLSICQKLNLLEGRIHFNADDLGDCSTMETNATAELKTTKEQNITAMYNEAATLCKSDDGLPKPIEGTYYYCARGKLEELGCVYPQTLSGEMKCISNDMDVVNRGTSTSNPARCLKLKSTLAEDYNRIADKKSLETCEMQAANALTNLKKYISSRTATKNQTAEANCKSFMPTKSDYTVAQTVQICKTDVLEEIGCRIKLDNGEFCIDKKEIPDLQSIKQKFDYLSDCQLVDFKLVATNNPVYKDCQTLIKEANQTYVNEIKSQISFDYTSAVEDCKQKENDGNHREIENTHYLCIAGELRKIGCGFSISDVKNDKCLPANQLIEVESLNAADVLGFGTNSTETCLRLAKKLQLYAQLNSTNFQSCDALTNSAAFNATKENYIAIRKKAFEDAKEMCKNSSNSKFIYNLYGEVHVCVAEQLKNTDACHLPMDITTCVNMSKANELIEVSQYEYLTPCENLEGKTVQEEDKKLCEKDVIFPLLQQSVAEIEKATNKTMHKTATEICSDASGDLQNHTYSGMFYFCAAGTLIEIGCIVPSTENAPEKMCLPKINYATVIPALSTNTNSSKCVLVRSELDEAYQNASSEFIKCQEKGLEEITMMVKEMDELKTNITWNMTDTCENVFTFGELRIDLQTATFCFENRTIMTIGCVLPSGSGLCVKQEKVDAAMKNAMPINYLSRCQQFNAKHEQIDANDIINCNETATVTHTNIVTEMTKLLETKVTDANNKCKNGHLPDLENVNSNRNDVMDVYACISKKLVHIGCKNSSIPDNCWSNTKISAELDFENLEAMMKSEIQINDVVTVCMFAERNLAFENAEPERCSDLKEEMIKAYDNNKVAKLKKMVYYNTTTKHYESLYEFSKMQSS